MIRFLPLLAFPFIFAFNFSPMSQSIELGEGKKAAQFLIQNEGATNIAVELTVKERDMNEKGEEVLNDTKEVVIFPPQIIIPPGDKRTIRVSYNGASDIKSEKSYRVIAEQLPLKVDAKTKNKAGIQMLMKFVAALYATPSDSKSEVKIMSYSIDGKELRLTVANNGNKHQLINNPILSFRGKEKVELKDNELKGFIGENILAGKTRSFTVPVTKAIPKDAKVELKIHD